MNVALLLSRYLLSRPEKPDEKKRRIACIGDSITFGAGVMATRKTEAWPAVWGERLGAGFQVLNYGVSGATLQNEGDCPYAKVGFLRELKAAKPELIVLMLGTNDSKPYNWEEERFAREYEALLTKLIALPWPHRVALMTPPRAFPEEKLGVIPFEIDNEVIRSRICPLVKALSASYALPLVDLYARTAEHPAYFCDGVHPNARGNRAIAEILFRELPL